MVAKYEIGEKVIVSPVNTGLKQYAGQSGDVKNYHWINVDRGAKVIYLYTVRIGSSQEELVLHEDELEPYI